MKDNLFTMKNWIDSMHLYEHGYFASLAILKEMTFEFAVLHTAQQFSQIRLWGLRLPVLFKRTLFGYAS